MSSNYVMTPNLIFCPIMECCRHEPLWRSQLKCSLKLIFKALTMRWFWKEPFTILNHGKHFYLECFLASFSNRNNVITLKLCSWLLIHHLIQLQHFISLTYELRLCRRQEITYIFPKCLQNRACDFKKVLMSANQVMTSY